MIPDSAIEAAHKAWREQAKQDGTIFEYNLRAAIEAAAPILMAQAWNEGHGAGQIDPYCLNGNPYDPRDMPAK